MHEVKRKFTSQSGASILMALAVMLVCTMVAAIVLVAAAANAGKSMTSVGQTRAFYAVSSAAQLLADDMTQNEPTANVTVTVKSYECQEQHPSYVHDDAGVPTDPELVFTLTDVTPLTLTIEEALYALDPTDSNARFERDFTIEADNMLPVDAHFVMDGSYNITIELSATPETGEYGYAMLLSIPSATGDPVVTTDVAADDSHMDGWEWEEGGDEYAWLDENMTPIDPSTGNHNPLSNEYGQAVSQSYHVTTTRTSTQLAWGAPVIEKGVS